MNDNGFIPTYDEYIILGHLRIINTDDKEIREKEIYPNSQFLWLGSDKDFVGWMNGLVETGQSPKGSKYKNFSEDSLNNKEEPFKHLPQKKDFGNNFLNPNKKISEIINRIIQLQ